MGPTDRTVDATVNGGEGGIAGTVLVPGPSGPTRQSACRQKLLQAIFSNPLVYVRGFEPHPALWRELGWGRPIGLWMPPLMAERGGLLGPSWSQALRARHAKARVVKNCSRQFFRTRLFMFVGSNPTPLCGVSSDGADRSDCG